MRKKRKQSEAKIRVLLVDDHAGMREALRRFINLQPDLSVVAEADGHSALDVFVRTRPDVVLMDGSMPGKNGIEVTRELRQVDRAVKVIGLTLYESSAYLEDMIAAGAKGYVLKTGAATHVAEAIRAVAAGKTYFDESIPRRPSASAETQTVAGDLSADELAVLKRVANGQTNDEIAADVGAQPVGGGETQDRRDEKTQCAQPRRARASGRAASVVSSRSVTAFSVNLIPTQSQQPKRFRCTCLCDI